MSAVCGYIECVRVKYVADVNNCIVLSKARAMSLNAPFEADGRM